MKIKSVTIKNVKGIANKTFALDLIPNKPNLLVAPNGFGKTSFAVAFGSMNSKRMTLDGDDHYQGDDSNPPELAVAIERDDGSMDTLTVDDHSNSLCGEIDVLVIKSHLLPKASKRKIGGFTQATPSLEVKPVDLGRVPDKLEFGYSYSSQKASFGANGKVLPNLTGLLGRPDFVTEVSNYDYRPFNGKRVDASISELVDAINAQSGNADQIKQWAVGSLLPQMKAIPCLNGLATALSSLQNTQFVGEIDTFLAAMEVVRLWKADPKRFAGASKFVLYCGEKSRYEQLLKDLYGGWAAVQLKEDKKHKSLAVTFPKAHLFSNGQRDLLSFVFMLEKAWLELRREKCILVIDEVFDYLDDANLVAFQFYITELIEFFKSQGRELFPVLLTHLDPALFHHWCFGGHKIKVHYLDVRPAGKSADTIKLIAARETDAAVAAGLDEDYFHYSPTPASHLGQFKTLGVRQEWEDPAVFLKYVRDERQRYLQARNYDPLAICFAVRIRIEEIVYDKIADAGQKATFLALHGTTRKLDYAASVGIEVPDSFYLLGIIYNDGLHWKQGRDLVSPMGVKLQHPVIRHLIESV